MENQVFKSNYKIFSDFIGDKVLCNNIAEIDPSVFDNMRFSMYLDDDCENEIEIYQWYLLAANDWEIELAEKNFPDALFTYSDKLDCFVLCVDHYGTPWSGVSFDTTEKAFEIGGPWDK